MKMQGRRFVLGLIASLCAVAVGLAIGPGSGQVEAAVWQGDMIRLHVIARSDSESDQRVKLAVRDALLEAFGAEFQADSYGSAAKIIQESLPAIQRVAQDAAQALGEMGEVRADFGSHPFPTRMYEDTMVPAGEYQALRVIIGDGEGRNWWCVVYPALCLADADNVTTAQQAMPLPGTEPPGEPVFTGALWNWITALFN
ncbi:MAG: stage II sporulation protein R [Clostridia bacterium]|nr:stage II sporulation protein R [Clostridia bacterium]